MASTTQYYDSSKQDVEHDDNDHLGGKVEGRVTEVNAASVALAAAVAEQKPSHFSPNMIRLWTIMALGYLVSTMNGYGE